MELWKSIPNYEGLYEASTEGRIRTAEGKTTRSARFEKRVWKQRILKPKMQKRRRGGINSDLRVNLWKDGKVKTLLVSRLVAMTWCEGYSAGMTVNHIDGNSLNNNANNLEWISLSQNIKHGFENGLYKTQKECTLISTDGERITFSSMAKASAFLGRPCGYISGCMKYGRELTTPTGYKFSVAF